MAEPSKNDYSGSYNGVRYLTADHDRWFSVKDVVNVLGAWDHDEDEIAKSHGVAFADIDGVRYMNGSGLATVVDLVVGGDYYSPRSMWVQGWYEDLEHFVETGEELEDFGEGTGESIITMIDDTCAMRTKGLRERAREAATELHEAADSLQGAQTFLDGFSSALVVVNASRMGANLLYTPNDDLVNASLGIGTALSIIEGIADGDDDGK